MEEYEPVDMSKIKLSKIRTEKELEKEIAEICKTLKDITTADWKDRIKAMQSIREIFVTEKCTQLPNFPKLMEKLVRPLIQQLMENRSAITKDASITIRVMVQSLENDFRPLAHKFMHSNALFKLVASATKIMVEHGHLCCLAIINYCQEQKVIDNILENVNSKHSHLRAMLAHYLSIIMDTWPENMLEKYLDSSETIIGSFKSKDKLGVPPAKRGGRSKQRGAKDSKLASSSNLKGGDGKPSLQEFLQTALTDASPECRQYAREAFLSFQEIFPEEAEPLIHQNRSTFMKHKEMVDKLGPILEGSSTFAKSANVDSGTKKARRENRMVEKPKTSTRPYLSPTATNRKSDLATKSQNRLPKPAKFLSQEREEQTKGIPSNTGSAAMSTGFRNLKASNYAAKNNPKEAYVSKNQLKPSSSVGVESGAGGGGGRTLSATAARPRTQYAPKNGFLERHKKLEQDEDNLVELDERCQDISEIGIDPEESKEDSLYPQPYQSYKVPSKATPEQEISELIEKADSKSWIERVAAFEQLANYISNKASSLPNVSTFCKIVNLHFDHLDDEHFKVILVVHKSFGKLVNSF